MIRKALPLLSLLTVTACTDSAIVGPEMPRHAPRLAVSTTADFWHTCTGIVCEFYTANVSSKSAEWDFGHNAFGTSPHVHHTFPQAGKSYTVTLRATDVDDRTHVVQREVDIFALSASPLRIRGKAATLLAWKPARGDIEVLRNGVKVTSIAAAANSGAWIDVSDVRALRVAPSYQVCSAGGLNCSDVAIAAP